MPPQKSPDVTEPVTSRSPATCTCAAVDPAALSATLSRRFAAAVGGNVIRARPVRVVTARSTPIGGPANVTEYRPGAACWDAGAKRAVVVSGDPATGPTVGRIGMSPYAGQPGPLRCVRLSPDSEVSPL